MNQDAYDSIDVVTLPGKEVESSLHSRKRRRDSVADGDRPSSGIKRRNRTNFSTEQVKYLETYFKALPYPDGMQRREIALHLTVSQQTVTFWFQNKRARARRMAGNPTVLASETKKRRELQLQPATNWYFPLTSSNAHSTPVPRRRDPSQPMTSSPIATALYHAYYPCPPSSSSGEQTTPPPHPYYPFHPQHAFYPQWILPVSTISTDPPAGQTYLPSVIEITPPSSVKEAGHDSSGNGSGGSSHLSTPLDSPLSVHNLIGGNC